MTVSHFPTGEKQGLHGPPPHPTQPVTEPSAASVPDRKSPTPSDDAPMNLKNCRRDDLRASLREIAWVTESVRA